MIAAIWNALGATGLIVKLGMGVGLVVALAIAYGVWHHKVFKEGYTRALFDIAAEDTAAIKRATDLRATWKTCRDRGGKWDQSAGTCS